MRKMFRRFFLDKNFANNRPSFSRLNILDMGSLLYEKRGNSLGNGRGTYFINFSAFACHAHQKIHIHLDSLRRGCIRNGDERDKRDPHICVHFAGRPREWRAISISQGKGVIRARAAVSKRPQFNFYFQRDVCYILYVVEHLWCIRNKVHYMFDICIAGAVPVVSYFIRKVRTK